MVGAGFSDEIERLQLPEGLQQLLRRVSARDEEYSRILGSNQCNVRVCIESAMCLNALFVQVCGQATNEDLVRRVRHVRLNDSRNDCALINANREKERLKCNERVEVIGKWMRTGLWLVASGGSGGEFLTAGHDAPVGFGHLWEEK